MPGRLEPLNRVCPEQRRLIVRSEPVEELRATVDGQYGLCRAVGANKGFTVSRPIDEVARAERLVGDSRDAVPAHCDIGSPKKRAGRWHDRVDNQVILS